MQPTRIMCKCMQARRRTVEVGVQVLELGDIVTNLQVPLHRHARGNVLAEVGMLACMEGALTWGCSFQSPGTSAWAFWSYMCAFMAGSCLQLTFHGRSHRAHLHQKVDGACVYHAAPLYCSPYVPPMRPLCTLPHSPAFPVLTWTMRSRPCRVYGYRWLSGGWHLRARTKGSRMAHSSWFTASILRLILYRCQVTVGRPALACA